jgi:hypothetical protein
LFDETLERGEQHFTASTDFCNERYISEKNFEVIIVFVDSLLSRTNPSILVLQRYQKRT